MGETGLVEKLGPLDLWCWGVVTLQRMKSEERWSVREAGRGQGNDVQGECVC